MRETQFRCRERGRNTSSLPLSHTHTSSFRARGLTHAPALHLRSKSQSFHRVLCTHSPSGAKIPVENTGIFASRSHQPALCVTAPWGEKQQFINEQTLVGSFREEFTDCRRKSSLLAPVPGSRRIFCRVRRETGLVSLQWRHYPKLTGRRWPQHPPYHFPLCIGKRPHGHMSQMKIFFLHCWINQVLYKWWWSDIVRSSAGSNPTAFVLHNRNLITTDFSLRVQE